MDAETKLIVTQVADEAATRAINNILTTLGIDIASPLEAQKDMVALREFRLLITDPAFQQDMAHLRKWRLTVEAVERKGTMFALAFSALGVGALIWIGMKAKLFGGF